MLHVKKHIFTLLLLWLAIGLSAAPITREQARQKAVEFLKNAPGSNQLAPVQNKAKLSPRRLAPKAQRELYYVFNRGDNEGYVIVSGDDKTLSVLGYTEEGEFDYNNLPDNMRYWLEGYENQLLYLSEHPESMTETPRYAPTHDRVEPMVKSKWNQGDPYNQECPMYFTLGRSITGCVATAMAQVLYYQRDKSVNEVQADIPAYTTRTSHATYGQLHVDGIPAGSPIDWNNMIDTYGSGASAKQKLAVAQLMHYCGVAVEMDYTNQSSGAFSSAVANAFNKYFGYGTSAKYAYKEGVYTDDSWDALLYKELAEGRPLYLSGSNEDGGHAFVCDGYDGNGCFHINWGWGGSSDGYFVLNKLNPSSQGLGGSSGGYSDYAEAVVGCEPVNYSAKAIPISNANVKKLCTAAFDADGDGTLTYGEVAAVTDLGDAFKGQTTITAFTELYYFTGLTAIADSAFAGCTKLTSIKLPKGIKHIGAHAFENCRALKTFALPDNVTSIGEGAFEGCRVLPNLALPSGITRIEDHSFSNCLAFTAITLPNGISYVGEEAFSGCTKLATVNLRSIEPQTIALGANVFADIDLSAATLNTPQGTRSYLAEADQWNAFGTIYEERNLSRGTYAELEINKKYYLYNVGTGCYLTNGEAYSTQAVVANTDAPMRFELRRTASMAENLYYLYTNDAPNSSRHYFFRTSTDGMVGNGVKACFVDGQSLTAASCYWKIVPVEGKENVYTIQIPSNNSAYVEGQYLGVQPDHDSNAASPTYGTYSDVVYDDYALNCQWMLVEYNKEELELYQASLALKNLLAIGTSKRADTTNEQVVYDNLDSKIEDIEKASRRLRNKLNFINFTDKAARKVFTSYYDVDGNGEISFTEAAQVEAIGAAFASNSDILDMSDLKYFTSAKYLAGTCFMNCMQLEKVIVPKNATGIYYRAFMGDRRLEYVDLGPNINNIGDNAFYFCAGLKEFRIAVHDPATISLGTNVFAGIALSNVVLYVPEGSKELYAAADVWKDFGEIREMRAVKSPKFVKPEANTDYYVYNVGMRRNIRKGEAYGTQAVVDLNGFVYQLRRSNAMADSVFYLYSEQTGTTNHVLFRTATDSKVGEGIKTCFVDGTLSAKAYWRLHEVEGLENIYTLQVPVKDADYTEGEYLGCDYNHDTNYTYGTYGLYWDINYAENPQGCQWAFISVEDVKAAQAFFDLTEVLKELLAIADAKTIEAEAEHAVYDNFESSEEDINAAILSLRHKLGYIDFADTRVRTLCVNNWDDDEDGELDLAEAAAITDIGTTFRSTPAIKSFEELQYFTSLTALPDEAFRGCTALTDLYVPANVTTIGERAFTSCSALKYLAVLNDKAVVEAAEAVLPSKLTVFVPQSQLEAYAANETWAKATVLPYTGQPVVTALPASRLYGRSNPAFTFAVEGAPINGEPELTTEAETTSPIGEYEIVAASGSITSPNLTMVNGTLTVERASLTLTARSFTRNRGEENPEFTFSNTSLRNREKIDDVLVVRPTLECDATPDSPAGKYEIRIFGAEADNYEITYVNGTLTVEDPNAVRGLQADDAEGPVYDLSGRRVVGAKRGVYVKNGKKVMK